MIKQPLVIVTSGIFYALNLKGFHFTKRTKRFLCVLVKNNTFESVFFVNLYYNRGV